MSATWCSEVGDARMPIFLPGILNNSQWEFRQQACLGRLLYFSLCCGLLLSHRLRRPFRIKHSIL